MSNALKSPPTTSEVNAWTHFGFSCKAGTMEGQRSHLIYKLCKSTMSLRNNLRKDHTEVLPVAKGRNANHVQMKPDKSFVCKLESSSGRAQKVTEATFVCQDPHHVGAPLCLLMFYKLSSDTKLTVNILFSLH